MNEKKGEFAHKLELQMGFDGKDAGNCDCGAAWGGPDALKAALDHQLLHHRVAIAHRLAITAARKGVEAKSLARMIPRERKLKAVVRPS